MTALRLTTRSLAVILLLVLALPLVWRLATGDFYMTVTGRSMSPTYEIGDVLVVRAPTGDELDRVGEVVVVRFGDGGAQQGRDGTAMYVHRVVEPTADGAWLQGDNNDERDPRPVAADDVLGTPRTALTGTVGAAFTHSQTVAGRVVLAGAALALLLLPVRKRVPA